MRRRSLKSNNLRKQFTPLTLHLHRLNQKTHRFFLSDTLRHLTPANVLPRCHSIVFAYFLELQSAPFSAARLALSALPAMPIAFEFVEPLLSVCTACAVPCPTNGSLVAIVVTGFNLNVSVPSWHSEFKRTSAVGCLRLRGSNLHVGFADYPTEPIFAY